MTSRLLQLVALVLLAAACGTTPGVDGGSGGSGGDDAGTGGGGGGAVGGGGGGGGGGAVTGACGEAVNLARRAQLLASQPSLETKKKTLLALVVTFPSEAGNPSELCEVQLQFKDSNGNGTLDPYEDWRSSPAARATDLLSKMGVEQKLGLLAHAATTDTTAVPSAASVALIAGNVRFASTSANSTAVLTRATWANALQEKAEEAPLGIPFVLSTTPVHSSGNGRVKATGFSQWPNEMALAASGDVALVEKFGKIVATEYQAIGIRLALSPSADLATDPRWFKAQFTFGEDSTQVGDFVAAYVKGLQGATLGPSSVAAVVSSFPGAGAAVGGADARLAAGKFTRYPGNNLDAHLAPFQKAITQGVAGVMTGYAIPQTGSWIAAGGTLAGASIEQVGASFNASLVTGVLRTRMAFTGLVIAPAGVLNDAAVSPLGAPWGVEALTPAARVAKAINAGVDQFAGLGDTVALQAAKTAGSITDAQIDAAAGRALALQFTLGLFEDPYVDAAAAPRLTNVDLSYRAGLAAMNRGMVLLVNQNKPAGWLNGNGDGSQLSDKGNAGNGTRKVLPAPPGEPYVAAGCRFFVMGDFDLDYVRSVSAGYGELTNDATSIGGVPVTTDAQKIALSDYVLVRIAAPFTADAAAGALNLPTPLLTWANAANEGTLAPLTTARAAIAAWAGLPASQTQLVVGIDVGRLPVLSEVLAFSPAGLYVVWNGTNASNLTADKTFLDVAFGIANGVGTLPVAVPASDAAAGTQQEDVAGDGAHSTFVKGFGLTTPRFE